MKTRNGFVSNSSSSSFIICLPRVPKSAGDVWDMLWPGETIIVDQFEREPISTSQAAEAVWNQIKDQKPLTRHAVANEFGNSWEASEEAERRVGEVQYGTAGYRAHQTKKYEVADIVADEMSEEFYKKHKKTKMYRVSFGDENGTFESTMEHSDVFSRVPNQRFSHH